MGNFAILGIPVKLLQCNKIQNNSSLISHRRSLLHFFSSSLFGSFVCLKTVLLLFRYTKLVLMKAILHHLRCMRPCNNGILYQPQLVSRISEPSTVLLQYTKLILRVRNLMWLWLGERGFNSSRYVLGKEPRTKWRPDIFHEILVV